MVWFVFVVLEKYNTKKGVQQRNDDDKSEESGINKYCKCSEAYCNCCRDFSLPLVNLSGPGTSQFHFHICFLWNDGSMVAIEWPVVWAFSEGK